MDGYDQEEDGMTAILDCVLGDPGSDFSDVEDEELVIRNAESEAEENIVLVVGNPPEEMDSKEGLNEFIHYLAAAGPSHRNDPMDLSDPAHLPQIRQVIINPTYTGRNKPVPTIWSNTPQPKPAGTGSQNLVTQLPGPRGQAQRAKTETECWKLFFPEYVIERLVRYTNIKIRQNQQNFVHVRDARETDICEMKALIGLLYLAGVCTSPKQNLRDLWKHNGLGVEIFRLTMGVNRFRFLLQHIRFDDVASEYRQRRKDTDRLYCFREFLEDFTSRCKENYSHSTSVTIDEMLVNFRGKCSFRAYNMPKKPGKFGIKVCAVTDSMTYYTSNLEVCVPNQNRGPFFLRTSTRDLVNRMVSHIENTGRNVTCVNFFTSISLAQDLLGKKLTLVGAIRKNNEEIPLEFTKDKKRPLHSSMFGFTSDETLVSYKAADKKLVLLLSTLHEDDEIDESTGDACKPAIVTFYNQHKFGVVISDAMQKEYSVARISNRWPLTMFFLELNIGGINSFIIWKENNAIVNAPRKVFLEALGHQLISDHAQRRIVATYPIARTMKDRIREIFQLEPASKQAPDQPGKYNVCRLCPRRKNRKTTVSCINCNIPICKEHTRPSCTNCTEAGIVVEFGEDSY